MAKADQNQVETAAREPVTERGPALLQLISESESGYLMLTQDEGSDIVNAGDAEIRSDIAQVDNTFAISLTEKGKAVLGAAPAKQKITRHQLTVSEGVDTSVAMPEGLGGAKRGRQGGSKYPFDTLNVGESFHIPKSETQANPLGSIQTSISQAHAKFVEEVKNEDGSTKMHDVVVKIYKRGEDGKFEVEDGKRVVLSSATESQPVMQPTRKFAAANVGSNDPKGEGARVWRIAN